MDAIANAGKFQAPVEGLPLRPPLNVLFNRFRKRGTGRFQTGLSRSAGHFLGRSSLALPAFTGSYVVGAADMTQVMEKAGFRQPTRYCSLENSLEGIATLDQLVCLEEINIYRELVAIRQCLLRSCTALSKLRVYSHPTDGTPPLP